MGFNSGFKGLTFLNVLDIACLSHTTCQIFLEISLFIYFAFVRDISLAAGFSKTLCQLLLDQLL